MDDLIEKEMTPAEKVRDFESLYESFWRCRKGVSWKPSVKHFSMNVIEKCMEMEAQLQTGKWKNGEPRPIIIRYPKRRDGLSIPFRDRVYQRSLNDLVLYPSMARSFIYDNCACQKGKGTDFARERMKTHLRRYFRKHGADGYVVQIDIHKYYPSMRHDLIRETFGERLDPEVLDMSMRVIEHQYTGDVGCNPGSQMVQIAGISVLNKIDHFIKEQLHVEHYIRYMDDFWMLFSDRKEAEEALSATVDELTKIGFSINEDKTHVMPLKAGFRFLGFDYRLTPAGKVLMTLNSDSVRHERRKLRRMTGLVREHKMTKEKVEECYLSWRSFAVKGNSWKLVQRMDRYLRELLKEV